MRLKTYAAAAYVLATMAVAIRADAQCTYTSDANVAQVAAAGWQMQPIQCMGPTDQATALPPPPVPMVVNAQKIIPTGGAPGRRASIAGGDPILGDGEFFEQRIDVSLPSFGPHFEFKRTYRSRVNSPTSGVLGFSWDHNYNKRIIAFQAPYWPSNTYDAPIVPPLRANCDTSAAPNARYIDGGFDYQDGELNIIHFHYVSTLGQKKTYQASRGVPLIAILDTSVPYDAGSSIDRNNFSPLFTVQDEQRGTTYDFDTHGQLIRERDLAGNALWFTHRLNDFPYYPIPLGPLESVDDGVRTIHFLYNKAGFLQCLSTSLLCDDEDQRDPGVLAYFEVDPVSKELQTVFQGTKTQGERYVYNHTDFQPNAWPKDCLSNPWIDTYCDALCGTIDPNNLDATCANADFTSLVNQACAQVSCQSYNYNPYISCLSKPTDLSHPDHACQQWNNILPDCRAGCRYRYQCQATFPSMPNPAQPYPYIAFGAVGDLLHNITEVYDESGQLVVHNEYGLEPWDVSFDHVVSQRLGPGQPSANESNVMTFNYHDLNIETAGGTDALVGYYTGLASTADPTHVLPIWNFDALNICPVASHGTNETNVPVSYDIYGQPTTDKTVRPATAVVITDVHGNTHTQYYDGDFNLLRQVDQDPSGVQREISEYNFDLNGVLVGSQAASGIRTCYKVDAFGAQYQVTTIPAVGHPGNQAPFVSVLAYDPNRQVTDVYYDVGGLMSATHMSRDPEERIIELDESINDQEQKKTFFTYDEDPPSAYESNFVPAPIRETPATVYHNSRTSPTSIDTYRHLDPSGGGAQQVVLNSGGDLPKVTNITYDSLGRTTDVTESSGIYYHYDYDSNTRRIQQVKRQLDPSSPIVAVQVAQHDSNGLQMDQLSEPKRTTYVEYSGQYPYEIDRVSNPGATKDEVPPPDPQYTCLHYAADGRLEDVLLPETNRIHYEYDFAGRPTSVTKGNDPVGTKWVDGRCANKQTTPLGNDNTGLFELSNIQYSQGGFVSAMYSDDKWRSVTTDGFGRIIQSASMAASSDVNVAVKQFGYDSRGRLVWTADLASESGLPATSYAEPVPGQTSGLLDLTSYQYDYLGRKTAVFRFVLETGELYTTTWNYDDAHSSMTMTDRGRSTQTVYDGLGRLRYSVLPDGSQVTVLQYQEGSALVAQDTNQGQQLRTYQWDSRGNLTAILDGNDGDRSLYSASYDDHGNLTNVTRAGEGAEIRYFDRFDRLVHHKKVLAEGQFLNEYQDWDRNDRPVAYTDGDLQVWRTIPTGYDSPFATIDPLSRTTQYYYQHYASHPAGMVEGNERSTCYRYDADLRLRYVYNAGSDCFRGNDGNILSPYTPMVERVMYSYTDTGEIAEVDASADASRPSPATVLLSYDSLGRTVSESSSGGDGSLVNYEVATSYSDLGRSINTQVSQVSITPDFCRNGSCSHPNVWMVAFSRHYADGLGRLSGVDLNGKTIATYTNGLGIGGPTSISYPSIATTAQLSYDSRLRRIGTNITYEPSGQTPSVIASLQDALGSDSVPRMRQRQFRGGAVLTDVYQVDGDRRMISENGQLLQTIAMLPNGATNDNVSALMTIGANWMQYGLDNEGNWATNTNQSGTVKTTMDQMGRLASMSVLNFSLDPTDNIQSTNSTQLPQFFFEPFTGLMYSAVKDNATYQYVYDALGRRAAEILPDGSMNVFLWDGQQIVAHGDQASLTVDVPGDDIDAHVASVEDGGAGQARYYHQGPDQSVLAVSDQNGLVEGYSYSAFGWTTASTAQSGFNNRFLFQGQLFDGQLSEPWTQTYSMRARQYWPALGRFLSPDPLSFMAGPSVYSFTGGRPLVMRDPLGLDPTDVDGDTGIPVPIVVDGGVTLSNGGSNGTHYAHGAPPPKGSGHGHSGGTAPVSPVVAAPVVKNMGSMDSIVDRVRAGTMELRGCSGMAAQSGYECAFGVYSIADNSLIDIYQRVGANSEGSNQALNFANRWAAKIAPNTTMNPRTKAGVELGINLFLGGVAPLADAASEAISTFAPKAYSVAFETTLQAAGVGTRASHFEAANTALLEAIESNPEFAGMMEELGIEVPTKATGAPMGESPAGWTWHHADSPGLMQLVPRFQHGAGTGKLWQSLFHPGGKGGFSIWGSLF